MLPTSEQEPTLITAHVLSLDIVGYSLLPIDEQTRALREIRRVVTGSLTFQAACAQKSVISLPSGDGMALAFFSGPECPVKCGLEISKGIRSSSDLKLRMGVHSGSVYRVQDINGENIVAGGGINMAQHVMDCGDADHILLSNAVAEVLKETTGWTEYIRELGEVEVKHGVRLRISNLCVGEDGNSAIPVKLQHTTESPIFWEILLQLLEEGKVIPIVGCDVLTVNDGDGARLLYPYLAQKLAAKLGVSPDNLPEGDELNEVACRCIAAGKLVEDIYPELKMLLSAAETALQVPEPLLKLAAIPKLRFFVTTTFDSFLSRALNQVRFGGNENTRVFAYSPSNPNELPSGFKFSNNLADAGPPVVYHLMGRFSATPVYAVTQEDIVEYFHSLQSETHRPQPLFDELNSKSLLILGCHFGGWLTRFLMRMSKAQRLSAGGKQDFVADAGVSSDHDLVLFLRNFSRATKIYHEGGVLDFIDKLHQRWMELHPAPPPGQVEPPPGQVEPPAQAPGQPLAVAGSVFLSYASEDRVSAEKIKNALEAVGIDVFFDRDKLEPGDDWESVLRSTIQQCSIFVAVISRRTSAPENRVFREACRLAVEEEERVPFGVQFLLPVVIDDTPVNEADVPQRFRAIQWQTLRSGQPTPEFVSQVRQLYRRNQLKSRATSG